MKKIILLVLNFLIGLSLASITLYYTIGGYSFNFGKIEISVHGARNPLFLFLISWGLRLFYLFVSEDSFRKQVFIFLKAPLAGFTNLTDSPELKAGTSSLITAFGLYLFFLIIQRGNSPLLSDLFMFTESIWGSVLSIVFLFFIIFFYLVWLKTCLNAGLILWASLIFIFNAWHTYRGAMIPEYNILILLFLLLALIFIRIGSSPLKFLIIFSLWLFLFQGVSLLIDAVLQTDPGFTEFFNFKDYLIFFSFAKKGLLAFSLSFILFLWYRQRFYIAIFLTALFSLILPVIFPQKLILYFPYVVLFSLVAGWGINLILKNQMTNSRLFDRNITFVCAVTILSLFFCYTKTNLQQLLEKISIKNNAASVIIEKEPHDLN